jgi:hypothetical protein
MAEEEDRARYDALWRISRLDGHGVVEGVEIDLRHELVDPKEWKSILIGNPLAVRQPRPDTPFIWFPWFGEFNKETIQKQAIADYVERHHKSPNENVVADLLLERTPEIFVYRGDKIYISHVIIERIGVDFDHPHDSEIRKAFMVIERANGQGVYVKSPLEFHGCTSFKYKKQRLNCGFERLIERICAHFDVKDIKEIDISEISELSYFSDSVFYAKSVKDRTNEARIKANMFEIDDVYWRASELLFLIDHAISLGYSWAKAEAEIEMKPLARDGLKAKENKAIAGKVSGAARRAEAEQGWRPHALELAKKIQAENQGLSQFDLARAIEDRWRLKIHCPKSQLAPAIRAWQKQGKLAKREPHK